MIVSEMDFSARDVQEFIAEQESQDIRSADSFRDELHHALYADESNQGIKLPWSKTHDRYQLKRGDVSLWAGPSGSFKSAIAGQIALWATQQVKVGVMSFEMSVGETLKRMCWQACGNPNPPESYMDEFLDYLKDKMWLYDHLDSIDAHKVTGCTHYMASELGIELVIVDCLIKIKGIHRDAEKEGRFLNTLNALAKAHNIHIALVHHIRKPDGQSQNKQFTKYDVRGSGELTDLAADVILVTKDQKKADLLNQKDLGRMLSPDEEEYLKRPCQTLALEKHRHGAYEGKIGLWMNRPAMQFLNSDQSRVHLEFPRT